MTYAGPVKESLAGALREIEEQGLTKHERVIVTPQQADIRVQTGEAVINFCANNYLGLADHPDLVAAAKRALDSHGFGMASVRFICGTQDIHKQLERAVADFLRMDDAILYTSCFDANGGLFETLLTAEDAIISDALNHASIIDGVRLCKAQRFRYANSDMNDLRAKLEEAKASGARRTLIATDGVFSMDGYIAKLDEICDLADEFGAMVMVDDSHASGFVGATGRGSIEHRGVIGRVDIVTSTLGKALGGASGGFTAARQEIVDTLRQRSRPYLFSNTVAPPIVAAGIEAFQLLTATTELRDRLQENTEYFRARMEETGFAILPGEHPITPVMFDAHAPNDARLAAAVADDLLGEGIYVIAFSFPVVPRGMARIRVQVSAAHTREHLDKAVAAFAKVGKAHDVI